MRRHMLALMLTVVLGMLVACTAASGAVRSGGKDGSAAHQPGEGRDPWLRPFRSDSIWNTAIGSGARYKPARFPLTDRNSPTWVYLHQVDQRDPEVPLIRSGGWRDRCSGTEPTGYRVGVPADFEIEPPRRLKNGHWRTPNNGFVFLLPDGRTLLNGDAGARCQPGGPIYGVMTGATETDLYGDGIAGAHGASHLSHLGGAIRPGELEGDAPIRHALDLVLHSKHLYSAGKSSKEATYRWPASSSDSYALDRNRPDAYVGSDPQLRMGSLLALPPDVTQDDLDVETAVGRSIFQALQDYGGYITDDSAWEANLLTVDAAAEGTFSWDDAVRAEFGRMVASLHVVTNNGPGSIGGGGVPRRPPLPELRHPNSLLDALGTAISSLASRLVLAGTSGPEG